MEKLTVSVITSSIGRPELRKTIESVRSQTYKARQYVYVNGPKYHDDARKVLDDFPGVHALYMPEETGDYGGGFGMADVFAAAPYLTNSDWIFYLNDDDFYDENHIESIMNMVQKNDLKWAYSLRKFVDVKGELICDDNWCSLGHWPIVATAQFLVDNSCFAVSRNLAKKYGLAWTALHTISDRCFFAALKESGEKSGCTGLSTVNYRIGTGTAQNSKEWYLQTASTVRAYFQGEYPWRKESIYP